MGAVATLLHRSMTSVGEFVQHLNITSAAPALDSELSSRYPVSDVGELVAALLRPAFLACLVLVGWAANVSVFQANRVDYMAVLGIGPEEVCTPRGLVLSAALLFAVLIALRGCILLTVATTPACLWALVAFYVAIPLVLCAPLPNVSARRFAFRRPLWQALRRCLFPLTTRETPFVEVLVADGLTSLNKCLFDLGLGIYALSRITGLPFSESLSVSEASREENHIVSVRTALDEGGRSPIPFLLWALPSLIRARQCCLTAHYADAWTRKVQYANLAKYMTALPTIFFAYCLANAPKPANRSVVMEELEDGPILLPLQLDASNIQGLWVLATLVNSVFSFMWDVVFDWGLLHAPLTVIAKTEPAGCSTLGLRPTLLLRQKVGIGVYHVAIFANLLGRALGPSLRLSPVCEAHIWGSFACSSIQQSMEVMRRCMWNVFRVEWQCVAKGVELMEV
eukprot:TRINITY_DN19459_c0_g2_i1.p1 TRINITY_DN19459_c0_g2~~TRINITY_DN19459_c0_g2_i1.p1  ORF type:complete len:453 (-),score=44.01 TRINITY_DN19459_c0_g2_i1:123-1481(-)